jgi:hypothetical protein
MTDPVIRAPAPTPDSTPPPDSASAPDPRGRPIVERIGMAAIALVLFVLFGIVAVAAFAGGEPFLGAMSGLGALMVGWAGGRTLFRG